MFARLVQVRTINALGKITSTIYDKANEAVASVDALGNRTTFAYDAAGRPRRLMNPLGNIVTSIYDKASQLVGTMNALGYRTSFAYDAAGRQVHVRDANLLTTTITYDAVGRRVAGINANLGRTTQLYDPIGQRFAVIDPNGHRTSFSFDADRRLTRQTDALLRITSYGYDAASRQVQRTDARGYCTTYIYDRASRVLGRRYPDGSRVTFAYDGLGQRLLMNDSTGRTTSTYDAGHRLRTVTNPAAKRITYGYDAIAERIRLIEPGGGLFTYVYDAARRVVYLSDTQALRSSFTYDNASRRVGLRMGNGVRVSYAYDKADQLLRVANFTSALTTISSFTYKFDPVGNRTRVVDADNSVTSWSYDNLYQVTRDLRFGTNSYGNTFAYDPAGNRLRWILEGGAWPLTYTYDAANQLLAQKEAPGVSSMSYDANGNLTFLGGIRYTYTWDFENRATKIAIGGGRDTFTYNADGQRVQWQNASTTMKQIWDGQNILEETDQNNVTQAIYTLEPAIYGKVLSQLRGTTASFYLFDGLGSTRALTNSGAVVTDSYLYDAFGDWSINTTTTNPFRWIGQLGYYYDVDFIQYMVRARLYRAPELGRFLSRDPLAPLSRLAILPFYTYANNAPTTNVDPSGLQPEIPPPTPGTPPAGWPPVAWPPPQGTVPGGAPPPGCAIPSAPTGPVIFPGHEWQCRIYLKACNTGNMLACNAYWACLNGGDDLANSCARACIQTVGFPPSAGPLPPGAGVGYPATSPNCWCSYLQHLACFGACRPFAPGTTVPPWGTGPLIGFNWCNFIKTCNTRLVPVFNSVPNCNKGTPGPPKQWPVPIGGPPGPCAGL